jgi:hypothetical protein
VLIAWCLVGWLFDIQCLEFALEEMIQFFCNRILEGSLGKGNIIPLEGN